MKSDSLRLDYRIISELIQPGSAVLDLGCGDGELLALLVRLKRCKVQGVEIDRQAIHRCVAKGLSVLHGDIDSGLVDYGDKSFDYVILNQSFQQVKKPDTVLKEALRIGKEVIVSFPNFAYYSARYQIFFKGRTPVTTSLPYEWYDTPNLHFLSIADFKDYCLKKNVRIEKTAFTDKMRTIKLFPNLCASTGIFILSERR